MSEKIELSKAISEVKKSYFELEKTDKDEDRYILINQIQKNMILAITLLKTAYPLDTLQEFQEMTTSFINWEKLLHNPLAKSSIVELNDELNRLIFKTISFVESLLVTKISTKKELDDIEQMLNHLTEQRLRRTISEETYKQASERLEKRKQKLIENE